MGNAARILADSESPDGVRLITFLVTFARMVLAEFTLESSMRAVV